MGLRALAVACDPGVDVFVGKGEVGRKIVDNVGAELGVDELAGDVAESVVEDAAGEVVGAVAACGCRFQGGPLSGVRGLSTGPCAGGN